MTISMDTTERDACITECLQYVKPMVNNYATAYKLEFDDLLQECAVSMLEAYDVAVSKSTHLKAYLYGVARTRLLAFVPRDERPVYLRACLNRVTMRFLSKRAFVMGL
jgi:DNA-directed RNA polymerase specialized sigma24 family protein